MRATFVPHERLCFGEGRLILPTLAAHGSYAHVKSLSSCHVRPTNLCRFFDGGSYRLTFLSLSLLDNLHFADGVGAR